jgi:RNA polymerase sigma-70 factor, ECF subfamily
MTENIIKPKQIRVEDEVLFKKFFLDHYDGMFRYCMTLVQNQADSEDIVQTVFTDFWQGKDNLIIHTSVQAYLYKSVFYMSMNRVKKSKVTDKYISSLSKMDERTSSSDPAIFQEVNEKVNEAINSLPEQCRKIFSLSRFEGMKYQQIADQLDLSVKTIENQMGKALKILRIHLSDYLHFIIVNLLIFFR